jgi:alkylated DNA repair protein (DNA oxidative demethylase)
MAETCAVSPFRHMTTAGGWRMSVAMTNCGAGGWVTDRTGYRDDSIVPETGYPWPAMPHVFTALASRAAERAVFPGFRPDACLIDRYAPGARLSQHQDRNERDFGTNRLGVAGPAGRLPVGRPEAFRPPPPRR